MTEQGPQAIYASNGWEIDLTRRELRSRGVSAPIGSRAFEILEVLVLAGGEVVNKYHLMDRVWPGAIVEENTLQFHISAIRKALGADRGLLKTVSGRGYRLLGDWTARQANEPEQRADFRERRPKQPFRTNLPVAASALIGRNAPKQHLLNVLSAYRVVTLTGPGGSERACWRWRSRVHSFRRSRATAGLSNWPRCPTPYSCRPRSQPCSACGSAARRFPPKSVARAIGGEKVLLVLDNCEHLADAAARLAEAIVRMCPNVSVLATSQEILRDRGRVCLSRAAARCAASARRWRACHQ